MPQPEPSPSRKMHYLITGAARGIGRSLALSLHSLGHRVYLLDSAGSELTHTLGLLSSASRSSSAQQQPSTTSPSSSSPSFAGRQTDVSSLSALREAVDHVTTFFGGRLDVLINNAMAMPHTLPGADDAGEAAMVGGAEDEVVAHWERQIAVGLSAPFHLTRLCVPLLRREGWKADGNGEVRPGCVVNVASTRADMAEVDHEGYSAAKAGLLGLSQSMSVSLGLSYGIRVNSLVLGWIEVGEQSREGDEEGRKWGEELTADDHGWHPAGRVGKAQDVLRAVQYLIESEFVTGSEVVVDGGVTRRMVYPE